MIRLVAPLFCFLLLWVSTSFADPSDPDVTTPPVTPVGKEALKLRVQELELRIVELKPRKLEAERKLRLLQSGLQDRNKYNDSRCGVPCTPVFGSVSCRARDFKAVDVEVVPRACEALFAADPKFEHVSSACARAIKGCGPVLKKLDAAEYVKTIQELAQEFRQLDANLTAANRELRNLTKSNHAREAPSDRAQKPETAPSASDLPLPEPIISVDSAKD